MKIIRSPLELQERHVYFKLANLRDNLTVYLKLEGLNPAGSIKIKAAINMVEDLEERGQIHPKRSKIIESSSGNLGVALSLVCKSKGYDFTCVTDPNSSHHCLRLMHTYGAKIIKVTERDENGGYLNTRIRLIEKMLADDPSLVWTNQYKSASNPDAHAQSTAKEILSDFPHLSHLFIGAGTTGTLVGCATFFKDAPRRPTLVAVDSVGSVTFGCAPGRRYIPGLGTSRRPEIFSRNHIDAFLNVAEADTIAMAHEILRRYHLLVGGSTATVLEGIVHYAKDNEIHGTIVAISPDFGDKYIDTIYDKTWVGERFPELNEDALEMPLHAPAPTSSPSRPWLSPSSQLSL